MLINISRKAVYKAAMKNKKKKLIKRIISEIMSEEDIKDEYEKFYNYSKKYDYRNVGGSLEINNQKMGFNSLDEFVKNLAEISAKMILKDIEECKEYGIENKDGYLYVPLDIYDTLPHNNDYGYPGNGRLLLQGFDWSYDKDNNYDYSFVVYMTI